MKTLKQLAQEALDVQNASNLEAVANGMEFERRRSLIRNLADILMGSPYNLSQEESYRVAIQRFSK